MNARIIPIRQGNALVNIYARDRLKNGNRLIEFKVADYTTGKRRFWSFSDEAKARTKAKEIAEALNGGRPETASLTEWQKKEYLEAEEMAKAVGLGLKESVMLFCQALKLIDDQPGRLLLAAQFYADHRNDKPPFTPKPIKDAADDFNKRQTGQKTLRKRVLTRHISNLARHFSG